MSRSLERKTWGKRLLLWSICMGIWGLSMQMSVGCAPNGAIDKSKYSTSCAKDDDCFAVIAGDLCACSCNFVYINKSALEAYQADAKEARSTCGTYGLTCAACNQPEQRNIVCLEKVCTLKQP